MMKYFYLVILLVIFGCFRIVSPACQQRNEDQAKGDDPTRVCRKACTTDSDCSGSLKKCLCDDFCGLSCFNPDAECDNITGTLDNGTISFRRDSLKYGARATYRCNRGYSIRGEPVRECRSTKKWSRQPPTCIRSCPAPKKIGYAYFNHFTEHDVYEPGVTVSYKCLTGRNPSGNPNVTCQPSYTWSTLNLLCVLKDCGSPPNILNGDYTPKGRTTFGTWITYFCDKGYRTTDVKTKTLCVSSGIWNTQAPTCKPVQCPPPISRLKNGRVIARGRAPWEYRRLITFHCNDGYLIDGKDSQLDASCNENGSWGETPSCAADLNAAFNNELEGYTVVSGSFNSRQYPNSLGIPGFGLFGTGVLSSVPYPMSPLEKICMQVDILSDSLIARAFSDGNTIDLKTFAPTGGWRTKIFWLITPRVNQTEVQLQFSTSTNSWIDNIKVLPSRQCAAEAIPKQIEPTKAPEATTTTATTTQKTQATKGTTTKKETTTVASTQQTTGVNRPATESPQMTSRGPYIPGEPMTTGTEKMTGTTKSTAKSGQTWTPSGPDIPGRNGRPGEPMTTNEAPTTRATSNMLRDLIIVICSIAVFLALAVIIFYIFCLRNNVKRVDNSPSILPIVNSGANPTTTLASNPSPRSDNTLIATETF